MLIAITGGSGFVGRHLASALMAEGARVRVVDRAAPPPEPFPWGLKDVTGFEFVQSDVADRRSLDGAFSGAAAVVHMAAISTLRACRVEPLAAFRVNVLGTANVLDACAEASVGRVLTLSSRRVTQAGAGGPPDVYAATKQIAETFTPLTTEQEVAMGKEVAAKMIAYFKPFQNEKAQAYVRKVGRAVALASARSLAAAIRKNQFDLVLTGLQSDDHGFGQTGVLLAELLGMPHATIIMQIEVQDGRPGGTGAGMKLKRELEAGWFQWVEVPLPAVLSIQSGINKPRYATLKGIMAAKKKEIVIIPRAELGVDFAPTHMVEKIYVPQKTKKTEFLSGTPKEVAAKLVERLKHEARVL